MYWWWSPKAPDFFCKVQPYRAIARNVLWYFTALDEHFDSLGMAKVRELVLAGCSAVLLYSSDLASGNVRLMMAIKEWVKNINDNPPDLVYDV